MITAVLRISPPLSPLDPTTIEATLVDWIRQRYVAELEVMEVQHRRDHLENNDGYQALLEKRALAGMLEIRPVAKKPDGSELHLEAGPVLRVGQLCDWDGEVFAKLLEDGLHDWLLSQGADPNVRVRLADRDAFVETLATAKPEADPRLAYGLAPKKDWATRLFMLIPLGLSVIILYTAWTWVDGVNDSFQQVKEKLDKNIREIEAHRTFIQQYYDKGVQSIKSGDAIYNEVIQRLGKLMKKDTTDQ